MSFIVHFQHYPSNYDVIMTSQRTQSHGKIYFLKICKYNNQISKLFLFYVKHYFLIKCGANFAPQRLSLFEFFAVFCFNRPLTYIVKKKPHIHYINLYMCEQLQIKVMKLLNKLFFLKVYTFLSIRSKYLCRIYFRKVCNGQHAS